jgi:multiple antibiotic resistance protein
MTLYTAAITLILVMDPLGNIPVFLSILKNYDFKTQRRIMVREALIAFAVLLVFLFFGKYVMSGLGLTTSALSIAGAIVLFLISLKMIFPSHTHEAPEDDREEPFIVPIAIPLIAGPSAMAIVMMWAARTPEHQMMLLSAVLIASFVFLVSMLMAHSLMRILGRRVLLAVERLMGMILITIAVQMFLSGMFEYLH